MKRLNFAVLTAGAVLIASIAAPNMANAASDTTGRRPSDVPAGEDARVTKVIDGNTIQVSLNGQTAIVRYIGIAAPTGSECYSAQATQANAALVNGKRVRLETDQLATNSGGVLLRYVYLLDGRMASEELLANGSARSAIESPNTKYQGNLMALESQAFAAKKGLWSRCKTAAPQDPYSATQCMTLSVEALMARTPTFQDQSLLKDGDCVIINKALNDAGEAWQGKYIYHPAGTVVSMTAGYLRWKDAFVPLTLDVNGNPFVFKSQRFPAKFNRPPAPGQRPSITPAHTEEGMVQLERIPENPSVLRIPGLSNLFQDQGNGKYQVLVDLFEYVSGDLRNPIMTDQGVK